MNHDTVDEILEYVKDQKGISYYELEAYAYDNDKLDWIKALKDKNIRGVIAICIRDERRDNKIPYRNDVQTNVQNALKAKIAYHERHRD